MKKNNKVLVGISLALSVNGAMAGSMGPVATNHEIVPFVSAEGFPAWIKFGGVQVSRNSVVNRADAGTFASAGARVAAGLSYTLMPEVHFTLETGWNYFGQTTGKVDQVSLGAKLYGADLLVGASYGFNEFNLFGHEVRGLELFGKVGTLFERTDITMDIPNIFLLTSDGYSYYVTNNMDSSVTEFIPEIKVGFNYNITPHLAATASYMHAFASAPSLNVSSLTVGSNVYAAMSSSLRVPTLDAAMFGLIYQFK